MGLVERFLGSALGQRLRQEAQSRWDDTVPNPAAQFGVGPQDFHINPVGALANKAGIPVVAGLTNQVLNVGTHGIGMTGELADNLVAQPLTGLILALAAHAPTTGSNPATAQTQQAIRDAGLLHPGREFDAAMGGPDKGTMALALALRFATNPANRGRTIGEIGANLDAAGRLPALAQALGDTSGFIDATNSVPRLVGLVKNANTPSPRAQMVQAGQLGGAEVPDLLGRISQGDVAAVSELRRRIESPEGFQRGDVRFRDMPTIGGERGLGPVQVLPTVEGNPAEQLRRQLFTPLDQPDNAPLRPRELVGHVALQPASDFNTRAGGRAGDVPQRGLLPGLGEHGGRGLGPEPTPTMTTARSVPGNVADLAGMAQRLGLTPRAGGPTLSIEHLPHGLPRQQNSTEDLLDAFRRMDERNIPPLPEPTPLEAALARKTSTPDLAPPTPTSPLSAPGGTLDDFTALIEGPWSTSKYLPPAEAFAKRLNVPVEQAQAWLDGLERQGVVGRLPDGELAFKPGGRGIANATPNAAPIATPGEDPRLTAALRDVGTLPPAGALGAADEAAARAANQLHPEDVAGYGRPFTPRTLDTTARGAAPELPVGDLSQLTTQDVNTLTSVAYDGVPRAIDNAIAAHPDPLERAQHALDLIQTDTTKARQLGAQFPELAQKVARVPEAVPNVDIPTAPTVEPLPAPGAQPSAATFDRAAIERDLSRGYSGKRLLEKVAEARDAAAKAGASFAPGEEPSYMKPLAQWLREEDAMTPADVARLTNEHRQFITDAAAQGKAVPSSVLSDFPGITEDIATAQLRQQYEALSRQVFDAEQELRFGKKGTPPTGKKAAALQSLVTDLRTQTEAIAQKLPTPLGGDIAAGDGGGRSANLAAFMADAHPLLKNADGTPKVLYHGTGAGDFPAFDTTRNKEGAFGTGAYFTSKPDLASHYAESLSNDGQLVSGDNIVHADGAPNVKPVYINLKNPAIWDELPPALQERLRRWVPGLSPAQVDASQRSLGHAGRLSGDEVRAELERLGYDGVIVPKRGGGLFKDASGRAKVRDLEEVVAFRPEQIKSATGNAGTYNPNDPSLLRATGLPLHLTNTLVGSGLGSAAGAAAGALAPATNWDDRKNHIAAGIGAGAVGGGLVGAGFGPEIERAIGQPFQRGSTWRLVGAQAATKGRADQAAANALNATNKLLPGRGDWVGLWKRLTVETVRNWGQDESWGRVVLRALQPGATGELAAVRQDAARYMGAATPREQLPVSTRGMLDSIGQDTYLPQLGESLSQDVRKGSNLSSVQTATGAAVLSLANPAAIAQNVAGVLLSGAKGAAAAGWSGVFRTINDFQHQTFRLAAFNDELAGLLGMGAGDFLDGLARRGVDVSTLPRSGGFTPAEVGKLAGPQAERAWANMSREAVTLAEDRVKFLFGDYGQHGAVERALGGALPFISWAVRAYPVALQMAADHPVAALALFQVMRLLSQGAGKDGRPGYTAGMIPVPTATPFVGPLLASLVPGNKGVVYIDPVGAISPVGGDVFAPGGEDAGQTWYQKATAWLGRTGLPGPNPAISTLAYATGLDYKAPGALSRTQGLENGLALLPGNKALPNAVPALLAAVRSKVSPVVGPAIGGQADKNAQPFDPLTRRYDELVQERTGHPLDDPGNQAYLVALADPENPLLKQARRDVLLSGAAKGAASFTSPIALAGQTSANRGYQAAKAGVPFDKARIDGSTSGTLQELMQAANARYTQQHPEVGTYGVSNPTDAKYTILRQWEASPNANWLKVNEPSAYNRAKKSLSELLGLTAATP